MALRDYVFQLMATDSQLNALGVTVDSLFTQNDTDTPQMRPYVVIRWGDTDPGLDGTYAINIKDFQIWVHSGPGDYAPIDAILLRLRQLLTGVEAANTGAGFITQIEWQGESDDLSDDAQGTITRYGEFHLVGSAV